MNNILKHLRENWLIVIFVGSMLVTSTTFSTRLADAEKKIVELQIVNDQIQKMQIDLAVIREQIININSKIQ